MRSNLKNLFLYIFHSALTHSFIFKGITHQPDSTETKSHHECVEMKDVPLLKAELGDSLTGPDIVTGRNAPQDNGEESEY